MANNVNALNTSVYAVYLRTFACLALPFLLLCVFASDVQKSVFFLGMADFEADFYNVLLYISERDPYFSDLNPGEHIYLPIAYLMIYPFAMLQDYSVMSLSDCWASGTALVSMLVFNFIQLAVFFYACCQMAKLLPHKILGGITILLSSLFLFSIERGTLVVLSAACIMLYLAWYKSESRKKRIIALSCLCVSSVLKVYPVMFGLLLLKDKRYKEIASCVGLSLLLVVLPFFFFKHSVSENIDMLVYNLKLNSEAYGASYLLPRFGMPHLALFLNMTTLASHSDWLYAILKALTLILSALSLLLAFCKPVGWKTVGLIACTVLMLPANSNLYQGLYICPVLILFLQQAKMSKTSLFYLALFVIMLNPIQFGSYGVFTISSTMTNLACICLWISLILGESVSFIKRKSVSV